MSSRFLVNKEEPLLAWRRLKGHCAQSVAISLLEPKRWDKVKKLWTFKLDYLADINGPVIAIKAQKERLIWEEHLYSMLLPQLQIEAPYCYGYLEESSRKQGWLFIECVDTQAFDRKNTMHQLAMSTWLGKLHHATASLEGKDLRGKPMTQINSNFFLNILNESLQLLASFGDPGLLPHSRKGENMYAIEAKLLLIRDHWSTVETILDESPHCLVHYDLKAANIGLCMNSPKPLVKPFDWEYAGWGSIACDLGATGIYEMEADLYISILQETWPKINVDAIVMLGRLGCLLRAIHTALWDLLGLKRDYLSIVDRKFAEHMGACGSYLDFIRELI